MPAFEPRSDPRSTSARWTRWLERFNTYLVAADIKDDEGKRTLSHFKRTYCIKLGPKYTRFLRC